MLKPRRKSGPNRSDHTLLLLEVPRNNDKKELAAEQMFAALHGILKPRKELLREGRVQDHVSFEIASIGKRIKFYVWVPNHLKTFVEGQIYAQYPSAQIFEMTEDYTQRQITNEVVYTTELVLTDPDPLPIKTFLSFEVDPLASITATLAKLEEPNEEMWIQIMARPVSDDWHKKGAQLVKSIKEGKSDMLGGLGSFVGTMLTALAKPPTYDGKTAAPKELSERDKSRIGAIEQKGAKLGYQVKVRILYTGSSATVARSRMQAIVGSFKQFNSTNLNGFQSKYASFAREKLAEFRVRHFLDKGFIMNIEELASLYHLPHASVETPNIVWATAKTSEPPANLPAEGQYDPKDLSLFGVTNFRGDNTVFGMLRGDRSRHLYILGQTGTGKSKLLELLTLSDIFYDQGFAIIDPHGDYAINMMAFIPESRIDDVVYFNPADTAYPIGFNPLEVPDPSLKNHISSELVGVLKRMFENSWGPRLEYILRYSILALLDYPNSTMLDITRILTDKKFRDEVLSYSQDIVVKNFWVTEFASWNEKFATEAVAPILNKVGAFVANPMIRNIVGQPKGSFNIRKLMDDGKILIVNLSRGLVGEDNAAILGAMLVTKIQLAAMSRADIPKIEDRRPFYLYVDEFQNFATDSFAVILSEARKYGLCLTVANQYINQMEQSVRDAVFGNVGSIVSGRVSPDDAPFLTKYFEPQFEAGDIVQMANQNFIASLTIAGEKSPAFSLKSLRVPDPTNDLSPQIIELSRQRYSTPKATIEELIEAAHIKDKSKSAAAAPTAQKPAAKPAHQASTASTPPSEAPKVISAPVKQLLEADKPAEAPQVQDGSEAPKKRKRKRNRKRKNRTDEGTSGTQTPNNHQPQVIQPSEPHTTKPQPAANEPKTMHPSDDETIIRLR